MKKRIAVCLLVLMITAIGFLVLTPTHEVEWQHVGNSWSRVIDGHCVEEKILDPAGILLHHMFEDALGRMHVVVYNGQTGEVIESRVN